MTDDLGRLDHLRRTNPKIARDVDTAGNALGYAHDSSLSAGLRIIGGVYPAPYRWYHHSSSYACWSPWGFSTWSGGFSFAFGFPCRWWWSPCYSWWWPTYVSCWYPYWYYNYWSPNPYGLYAPTYSTIVYETVYRDVYESTVADSAAAPAEAVEAQPVQRAEEAPQPPRLGIAAERYLVLGDRAFREGRYTDAVQFYAKAIELDSDEGALYLVLSDALFAAGDYHYAAYAIRKALELDSSLAQAVVDKHGFYGDPSAFDAQLRLLESYVGEHPTDRDARLVLALNYLFGQRAADASIVLSSYRTSGLKVDAAIEALESSVAEVLAPRGSSPK
jgi:hypothetical protein